MMVAFKTDGASDGAQVERRVAPVEDPVPSPPALRTRGWQGRRGVSAGARKHLQEHRIHGWCWITHDTMLARVHGGLESKVERRVLHLGGWSVCAGCAAAGGGGS